MFRFIPAYAGNSARNGSVCRLPSVHPRLRGELVMFNVISPDARGSSPLTRGTRPKFRLHACSGSVHPRLRGELMPHLRNPCLLPGSSPLTRGTHGQSGSRNRKIRFIPAYAGNSLKQGIEHLTNSSKDFLSGKYAKNPETVLNHFKNSSLD